MEHLSLYEFAANWEVEYRNRAKFTDRDSDDEQAELDEAPFLLDDANDAQRADVFATRPRAHLNREVLGDNKHTVIKERMKAAIISTPNFNLETQAERFYYNLLVLFVLYRNEETLVLPGETPETAFLRARNTFATSSSAT